MKPLKSRVMPVYPKSTSADTKYWDIDNTDRSYLFEFMVRYLANMAEVCTTDADIQRDFYRRRPNRWPRGRFGPNSDASIIGGIIDQLLKGHDLTTAHLDAIEQIFDTIGQMYADAGGQAIRFDRRVFRIE